MKVNLVKLCNVNIFLYRGTRTYKYDTIKHEQLFTFISFDIKISFFCSTFSQKPKLKHGKNETELCIKCVC